MKVLICSDGPDGVRPAEMFGIEVEATHTAKPLASLDGFDAVIVKSGGFFRFDCLDKKQTLLATDEALRFAANALDAEVPVCAIISPVVYSIREIRRAFPGHYVSEHVHYVGRVSVDADLDASDSFITWVHVWDRNPFVAVPRHVFFFQDRLATKKGDVNWIYYLNTAQFEAKRARDVSIIRKDPSGGRVKEQPQSGD